MNLHFCRTTETPAGISGNSIKLVHSFLEVSCCNETVLLYKLCLWSSQNKWSSINISPIKSALSTLGCSESAIYVTYLKLVRLFLWPQLCQKQKKKKKLTDINLVWQLEQSQLLNSHWYHKTRLRLKTQGITFFLSLFLLLASHF